MKGASLMLRWKPRARLITALLPVLQVTSPASPAIDASHPGGNIRILRSEENVFVLAPDLRDTKGWWFHFNFRLRAPAGAPVTIIMPDPNPTGVRGPAVSTDEGRTWRWMGTDSMRRIVHEGGQAWSFTTAVPAGSGEIRHAFAPAYQESHLRAWLDRKRDDPALRTEVLTRSRRGRPVEMIRAGCLDGNRARGIVLLTARHHACESIASYSLEGLLDAVLADDADGRQWRGKWLVLALPFADKDGVEDGDQGKNRQPHDHNRDYNASQIYPEVAAWMKLGQSMSGRVLLSLDLHCPHIRGQWNDRVYIVGASDPGRAAQERAFARILERCRSGPIPYSATEGYLPSGAAWNKAGNYAAGRSNAAWGREAFPNARLASTIEIAYADASGAEVTADSARALGRDLARAIALHLSADGAVAPAR